MMVDTHSHLNLEQFKGDYEEILEVMRTKNVVTNTVGVDLNSSLESIRISELSKGVSKSIIGFHPAYIEKGVDYSSELVNIKAQLSHELVVGIGECGFDYNYYERSAIKQSQEVVFGEQIAWSRESGKPLMLHTRSSKDTFDAYEDSLDLLKQLPGTRGQVHFFCGSKEIATQFLDLGYYISFTGVLTFAPIYSELLQHVPIDRLLLETDAPYVAPVPYRGTRCEPWHVISTYEKAAQLLQLDMNTLSEILRKNCTDLYGY